MDYSRKSIARIIGSLFVCGLFLAINVALSDRCNAQVVQLPHIQNFGVGSTIVVPDGGSAYLGGIKYGASGMNSRGVPLFSALPGLNRLGANRSIGSSVGGGSTTVHVQILDMEELDRQVLEEGRRRREAREAASGLSPEKKRKADFINKNIGRKN